MRDRQFGASDRGAGGGSGPNATWFVDFYQDAPVDPRDDLTILRNAAGTPPQQSITMDNGPVVNL